MNWTKVDWKEYDEIYKPKRNVNNHASWKIHHMMGAFYSNKMDVVVEYESFGELLAYFLFEIDKSILRYYVQPVKIDITTLTETGERKVWSHVPDVLVFRNGSNPLLYQIKDSKYELPENMDVINNKCIHYANVNGWSYSIVYPKDMPNIISKNIKLISSRTKKRVYYEDWIPEIIYRLTAEKTQTIIDLAMGFRTKINPSMIIPIIYYLISIGVLKVDISRKVDQFSQVVLNNDENIFDEYFLCEGVLSV